MDSILESGDFTLVLVDFCVCLESFCGNFPCFRVRVFDNACCLCLRGFELSRNGSPDVFQLGLEVPDRAVLGQSSVFFAKRGALGVELSAFEIQSRAFVAKGSELRLELSASRL